MMVGIRILKPVISASQDIFSKELKFECVDLMVTGLVMTPYASVTNGLIKRRTSNCHCIFTNCYNAVIGLYCVVS